MAVKTTIQLLSFLGLVLGFAFQLTAQNTVVVGPLFNGEKITLSHEFLVPDSTVQFPIKTNAHTYEFNLVNTTQSEQTISFVVEDPTVSFISISRLIDDKWVEIGKGGSSILKENRSYSGLTFTCQTEIGIGYYPVNFRITISVKPNIKTPHLWVSSTKDVDHITARNTFVLGILFGLLLIIFVYTLFSFFSLKQAYFIWFSFFILTLGVKISIRTGVFSYVINGISEVALDDISSIFTTLVFIAFTRFLQLLLNTKKQFPNLNQFLIAVVVLRITIHFFTILLPDYEWTNVLTFSRIGLLFALLIGIYISLINRRSNTWFLIAILCAFGFLIFAGLLGGFLDLGVLQTNFIALSFWVSAVLTQLLMFLWVISIQVNQIANEHTLLGEKMRETKKALVKAHITGINTEKKHISKELNVFVLEKIKTITRDLKHEKSLSLELSHELSNIKTDIQHISDELQYDSSSSFIDKIQELVHRHHTPQMQVQLQCLGYDGEVSVHIQQNLFRVIQESIQNIEKYATASLVIIEINKNFERLNLNITDNGVGFDSSSSTTGIGIENMQLRIKNLNGSFQLKTSISKGVSIQISVPLTDD